MIVDPSHAAGKVDLVEPLSLAAIAAGADGLMIEMHPTPETALSDGAQSLDPAQFARVTDTDSADRRLGRQDPGLGSVPGARQHSGVHRLAVIGVGLMGGSLALAARRRAGVDEVVGYDSDPMALERGARAWAVITETAGSAVEAAAYADLVVVAAPVSSIPEFVEECADAEPRPRLITDMGSTKSAIIGSAVADRAVHVHRRSSHLRQRRRRARVLRAPTCSTGRPTFCAPRARPFPKLYEMLQTFVTGLGARPTHIDAVAHDRIMAAVSHLPHVLANVLMEYAGDFEAGGRQRPSIGQGRASRT